MIKTSNVVDVQLSKSLVSIATISFFSSRATNLTVITVITSPCPPFSDLSTSANEEPQIS